MQKNLTMTVSALLRACLIVLGLGLVCAAAARAAETKNTVDYAMAAGELLAGLAVFLFGIDLLAENMQKAAGNRMRNILAWVTANRFAGAMGGVAVTVLMQSSSATTVLLVSFSQAHLITAAQSVSVVVGSNIGTTITTQLIAFKLTDYALFAVALGYVIHVFSKRQNLKWMGLAVMGAGFLFYGMHLMGGAMKPLRSEPWFAEFILSLKNPWMGVAAGTLLTALIQSSAAFTGIVIALSIQGLVSLNMALPLIFGANIGTCVTALLASLQASREAKRVALIHILFNVGGVAIFFFFIPQLADLVRWMSTGDPMAPGAIPRQIANAHTIFNLAAALLFLPFTSQIARLSLFLMPVTAREFTEIVKPKYLDWNLVNNSGLALERVWLELIYIGEIVESMIENSLDSIEKSDPALVEKVIRTDDKVDELVSQTNQYMAQVLVGDLQNKQVHEGQVLLSIVAELDHIADMLETSTSRLINRKIEKDISFSRQGQAEIESLFASVLLAFRGAMAFVAKPTREQAEELMGLKQMLAEIDDMSRAVHFQRVSAGVPESVESHQLHLDLLDQVRILDTHIHAIINYEQKYWEQLKKEE